MIDFTTLAALAGGVIALLVLIQTRRPGPVLTVVFAAALVIVVADPSVLGKVAKAIGSAITALIDNALSF